SMSPEGKEAYRLFNDAKAKQHFEQVQNADPSAEGAATDDLPILQKIFQQYFITSVGDKSADCLGDAYFEAGDFLNADASWKAILTSYPDTTISKVRLQIKRG